MSLCPGCGKQVKSGKEGDWCRNCGYEFRTPKYLPKEKAVCPNCGKTVSTGRAGDWCRNCGYVFEDKKTWSGSKQTKTEKSANNRSANSIGIFVAVLLDILVAAWILIHTLQIRITGTVTPIK